MRIGGFGYRCNVLVMYKWIDLSFWMLSYVGVLSSSSKISSMSVWIFLSNLGFCIK